MTKSDMTVRDKALAHFKSRLSGDLQKITVPEWDCEIYYRATSSMATEAKILKLTTDGKTAEALVESIVQKALDAEGKKVFHETDRAMLMNETDPAVLVRIATALNNASADSIEAVEKN
jgi:hypothetical protein